MNTIKILEAKMGGNGPVFIVVAEGGDELADPCRAVDDLKCFFSACDTHMILMRDDYSMNEIAVRLAYRMKGTSLTGVSRITAEQGCFCVEKQIYSENITGVFELREPPFVLTCQDDAVFQTGELRTEWKDLLAEAQEVQEITWDARRTNVLSYERRVHDENLSEAERVVIGGRGAANKKGKELLQSFAETISASVGASRAAVMDGCWGFDQLVGASGKKLNAEMAITFGVSGAAPFAAGLTNCSCVISVNNDQKAPIFNNSDYGVVSDYQTIITCLTADSGEKK